MVAHADAADGAGLTHLRCIRAAMNINITSHGIDSAQPVEADLATGKPQNTRQNPVTPWKTGAQLRRVNFTGGTAPHEYRADCLASADFGANNVLSQRRAETAARLPGPIPGGRNAVTPDNTLIVII